MTATDKAPSFALGVDLGTTNSLVASTDLAQERPEPPQIEEVDQVLSPGEVGTTPQLPSFLFLPTEAELKPGAFTLPWGDPGACAAGVYARTRAAQVPARVIASAKSWLCNPHVDRRAAILPWQAPDDVDKLSPVEAATRYLAHLRAAWDHAHPAAPMEAQEIVITVPASFDAVARSLTEEAARQALPGASFTLLEEPQAALYAWLASAESSWRKQVSVGDVILVCDIGGGTTDFSLIEVREEAGSVALHRVAVGDHILLGGDNMDLALAYRLKAKLEAQKKSIDDWQLRALTHGCRQAKEQLLAKPKQAKAAIAVPGRGSKLVGGTLRTELTRDELDETLLDGFFPPVAADARPQTRQVALTTLGLPYAADAAVTRHLAAFLGRHRDQTASGDDAAGSFRHPTAVLFNGGVSKAAPLRERVVEVLDGWLAVEGAQPVKLLAGADPDLAVAQGAAYYGRVRQGRGVRIRGGTARAYYVGIERAELAVPGVPPRLDAICVAPFGMEEGTEVELPQELGLVKGEAVSFRFFASPTRRDDGVSDVADPDAEQIEELPPIEAQIEGENAETVPVRISARVTEVGTLELAAVESASGERHRLEFNIRVE